MTVSLFLATCFLWLIVGALILRFVIGGVIDCFKKGTKASIASWVGFVIATILLLLLL